MMRSCTEIARRIAQIIMSPESVIGFLDGVLSVPKDIGYLACGVMDTDTRSCREVEKTRMVRAIRYGILEDHNFTKTIEIILHAFNKDVPESKQNAIYSKTIASMTGRAVTNSVISSRIATSIAQSSSLFVKLRGGIIGNTLLIGGTIERCLYTSERLRQVNPEIYYALRQRNFDLIYFFLEQPLNQFIGALNIRRT